MTNVCQYSKYIQNHLSDQERAIICNYILGFIKRNSLCLKDIQNYNLDTYCKEEIPFCVSTESMPSSPSALSKTGKRNAGKHLIATERRHITGTKSA